MKIKYSLFIVLFFSSCSKEIDLPFPSSEPQIVLNGILHPDSIIRISLTTTIPLAPESTDFPVVDNATVRLYEEDQFIGNPTLQDGKYVLDYYPKAGSTYTIQAEVPDYEVVSATDKVPFPLDAQACFLSEPPPGFYYVWFEATIKDPLSEANFYWLNVLVTDYGDEECEFFPGQDPPVRCVGDISTLFTKKMEFLHSYSTIPDHFNAIVDNTSNGVSEYDSYIRIDDTALDSESITLEMTSHSYPMFQYGELDRLDSNQTVVLEITSASQHYDRYLKSSWIYFQNNDYFYEPNPFSETTQIYSNVKNGTGIFAAYNSVSIEVKNYPCQ